MRTIADLEEENPNPVFYCENCDESFSSSEMREAGRAWIVCDGNHAVLSATCPRCNVEDTCFAERYTMTRKEKTK